MLRDDMTVPYLVTIIDHGCHIRWLQGGGALKGRQHKTYNTGTINNSAAGPPRYTIEHDQYNVNDVSSLGISAHPSDHRAAAQAVSESSHSSIRGGTAIHHVLHYLGYILHQ